MTKAELIKQLADVPDNTPIIMSSDEEGNEFHNLYAVEVETDVTGKIPVVLLWPDHVLIGE